MPEALIGIIVLLVVVNVGCVAYTFKSFQNSQEQNSRLLMQAYDQGIAVAREERQFWQHQLQIAVNRDQFPDIAAMQTSSSTPRPVPDDPDEEEAVYVDETREAQLQESEINGTSPPPASWPGRPAGIRS